MPAFFGCPVSSLSRFKNNIYKNGKKSVGKSVFGFGFWTFFLSIFENLKYFSQKTEAL
jgi:hypothetical protein